MKPARTFSSISKRIIEIPAGSISLALFLLPPLHLLYLYALATHTREAEPERRSTMLLYVLGIAFFAIVLGTFIFINLPGLFDSPYLSGQLLLFEFGMAVLYLMFLLHLSISSVEYSRKRLAHRYFEFTDMDYVLRFFTLLFMPFTIWHLHKLLRNEWELHDEFADRSQTESFPLKEGSPES